MVDKKAETIEEGIKKILLKGCNNNVFSAASVGVSFRSHEREYCFETYCGTTDEKRAVTVTECTLFDLASLTKPLVTLLSILVLIDEKKLFWGDQIKTFFPPDECGPYKDVTIYHLLCHASGLPPHKEYWHELCRMDTEHKKRWLIHRVLNEDRTDRTTSKHVYSDLGYILLGFIIEEKTGIDLANFWKEKIVTPLGLERQLLFPECGKNKKHNYAATRSFDQKQQLQGEVHDDNCRAMGGGGGHAGLFGTTSGVLELCRQLLGIIKGNKSVLPFSRETLLQAISQVGRSEWTAGFNMVSASGSSSGNYFSPGSIGHLGFTGTSFWIDPEKELIVVLLTNRVLKGGDQRGIKALRPHVHNYIVEQLRKGEKKPPGFLY